MAQHRAERLKVQTGLSQNPPVPWFLAFADLSLFDKLLTEASRMKEFHSVQHKIYCDEVESLIYMWKLGMYPIDFAPVPGREFMRHPTYQYTTETKLPWTRGEELALTLRNRLLGECASWISLQPFEMCGAACCTSLYVLKRHRLSQP